MSHFSSSAAPSAPPPARVSARSSSLLICKIMQSTLGLQRDEVTPEMLRRCKTMQFEQEGAVTTACSNRDAQEEGASITTQPQTESNAIACLWKCMYRCVQLELIQPYVDTEVEMFASPAMVANSSLSGISAAAFPPIQQLHESWMHRGSDADVRACVLQSLERWGCTLPCVIFAINTTAISSVASARTAVQPNWSARQALLVLDWLIDHTHLRQRYVRILAAENAHGWFAAIAATPSTAAQATANAITARISKTSQQQPQFPQPLLPPAVWDSAGSLSALGYLEQSDEYRLLQQLLREAGARAAESSNDRSAAASSSMCLPPPTSYDDGGGGIVVSSHPSYSHTRLSHRVNQCVTLLGRLRHRLTKLTTISSERAATLATLQTLQKHPALRGSGGGSWKVGTAYTPREIQIVQSGSIAQRNLRDQLRAIVADMPQALLENPIQLEPTIQVWRAWIESVAKLQAQQEEEEEQKETGEQIRPTPSVASSATSSTSSSPLSSARSSRSGFALPPHLRAAAAVAAAARSNSRTRQTASSSSSASSASSTRLTGLPRPPQPLSDPSVALWRALTHPVEFSSSAATSPATINSTPTPLEDLLRRLLRSSVGCYTLSDEERADLRSLAVPAGEDNNSFDATRSAAAHAVAAPSHVRWSQQSSTLQLLLDLQRSQSSQLRLDNCTLVEQAMLAAADQGHSAREDQPDRFAFTVHT